nr:MAG TPA: hypothetical protein [Caudoviricetes sp.]
MPPGSCVAQGPGGVFSVTLCVEGCGTGGAAAQARGSSHSPLRHESHTLGG